MKFKEYYLKEYTEGSYDIKRSDKKGSIKINMPAGQKRAENDTEKKLWKKHDEEYEKAREKQLEIHKAHHPHINMMYDERDKLRTEHKKSTDVNRKKQIEKKLSQLEQNVKPHHEAVDKSIEELKKLKEKHEKEKEQFHNKTHSEKK